LLNVLEPPENVPPNPLRRGPLAVNFVKNVRHTPLSYAASLGKAESYPGFSLILLQKTHEKDEKWKTAFYSNRFFAEAEVLSSVVYGFGCCPRNRPFLKVQHGLQRFQDVLHKYPLTTDLDKWRFVEDLLHVLNDKTTCFPDAQLQSQNPHRSRELQEKLSSCFIEFPSQYKYGTRTHTVILIDGMNNVTHIERTMDEKDFNAPWIETKHEFQLKTKTEDLCEF